MRKIVIILILMLFVLSNVSLIALSEKDISTFLPQDAIEHFDQQYNTEYNPQTGENWWNSGWSYRKLITLDYTQVPSTQTNFPCLINISDSDVSSGAQASGNDITFILYSDNTTQLNHEIEMYSAGRLTAWVNVTSLSHAANTLIWMYYGNAGCGSQEHITATWDSGYACVYHFAGSSAIALDDSTINNNDIASATGDPVYNTTGRFGKAVNIDVNDGLIVPSDSSLNFSTSFTTEMYFDVDSAPWGGGGDHNMFAKNNAGNSEYVSLSWGDAQDRFYQYANDGTYFVCSDVIGPSDWVHLATRVVESSVTSKVYYNNAGSAFATNSNTIEPNNNALHIGNNENIDAGLVGDLEEFRLSNVLRTEDYLTTSYNTMNNASTGAGNPFIATIGSQETPQGTNFIIYATLNFSGQTNVQSNSAPIITNPNPSNGVWEIPTTTNSWNCTIEDPNGDIMNITIQGSQDIGINASTNCLNGSYNISIHSNNLSQSSTYTIWVNASDGTTNTANTFTFHTENSTFFTLINSTSFSGMTEVQQGTPAIPTITTHPAEGVEESNATLRGYITDGEGEVCTGRFQYGFDTNYGNTTSNQDNLPNHSYYINNIPDLNNGSYYHFRALANNSNVTSGYGADAVFLTKPLATTSLTTVTYNHSQINLSWTTGNGANNTYIERNTFDGWARDSGTLVCNITGTDYKDWNLSQGNTYYYQAWSFTTFGGLIQWSDANDSSFNTTDTIGLNVTINGAKFTEEINSTLIGKILNNDSEDTTCYFLLNAWTNDFSSPTVNQSVGVQTQGTTFEYNIVLVNGTYYHAKTQGNNIYGWNSSWNTTTLLTKPQPTTSFDAVTIGGGYNLSWTHGNGYNESVLIMNLTHYPQHLNDGTNLYQGKNDFYHHIGLTPGQTYYYRVWEYIAYAELYQQSDGNESLNRQYKAEQPVLTNPNPANESTNNLWNTVLWNITIESPNGNTFNWTIQGSKNIGINASNNCVNGSYNITINLGNLTNETTYTVWVNASETINNNWTNETFWFSTYQPSFIVYDTLSFSGFLNVSGNEPQLTNPIPTNQSSGSITTPRLYITVTEPEGQLFNVTWSTNESGSWVDFAWNSSVSSGTFSQIATWATGLFQHYWWKIYVNDTDQSGANATYWFITESGTPIISNPGPANASTSQDMYPLLNITVEDPQGDNFNVSWSTNATGTWVYYNSSVTNGSYNQRATFANASNTTYWWTVKVNDTGGLWTNATYHFTTATYSWGNWSDFWTFNYTCCSPTNFTTSTYSKSAINLSWSNCENGADRNVLVVNKSGWASYPLDPINTTQGTEIYNGTNASFNHTGLLQGTTFYYTIWGYNITTNNYSIVNYSALNTTYSEPTIDVIYPGNGTGDIEKTPLCRIWANDTDGDTLTITWMENSTGSWITRNINTSFTPNNTAGYEFSQFNVYGTSYWWRVYVNDGETNVSIQLNFTTAPNIAPNQTGEGPVNGSTAQTTPQLNITISDNNADSCNVTWWSNSSGAWLQFNENLSIDTSSPVNLKQTNSNFSALDTMYWWRVNLTDGTTWINDTYHFTTQDMDMCCPYPVNQSTGQSRPPTNISQRINGTNIDVYFYFNNMTPASNTTTLFANWSDISNTWCSFNLFNWSVPGDENTDWVWGNVRYIWYVNITDGSVWDNRTYYYDTTGSRFDVDDSGDIVATDVSRTWAHRAGEAVYNGIYDVGYNGDITATDCSTVWANRT